MLHSWWKSPLGSLILLLLLTLAAHGIGLAGGFVFDDFRVVFNPVIQGHAPLTEIIASDYWGQSGQKSLGSYRPLAVFNLWLEYRIWKQQPFGYHLTNLLWMLLVCWLVFQFTRALGFSDGLSLLAGVIFCIHPIHTENVASIAGRADLLSAFFFLSA